MKKKLLTGVTLSCLMFTIVQAWGAGFALYENSSRGTAICGAFVAQADDPSAVFYNPSGITQLEGRHITNGINTYTGFVEIHYPGGGSESVKEKTWFVPNFYLSQQVTDKMWIGLGAFAPFGLGNQYRENWYGRYNMYHAEIACMELNSNVAIKVNDSLSVAFGISRQSFEILSKRKIDPKSQIIAGLSAMGLADQINANMISNLNELGDIDQEVLLEKPAYRYNVSFRYQINEKLSVGGNYRSKVSYTLTGDVEYNDLPSIKATYEAFTQQGIAMLNGTLTNAKVAADISLPDLYIFGIAYKVTDKLTVEADIVRTQWSVYDKLTYHFENGLGDTEDKTGWKNVNCYRFGAEYQVNDQWVARLGYLFDESPLDDNYVDFSLPGNDRHLFTSGFGFKYNKFTIDAHYGLVICLDRDNKANLNPNAFIDYEWQHTGSYTHQLGFNVSYDF
ncbi:MAG: outer membrane protein transport protein [Candidatus Magnetomorum sp.]|nr:outer membrane protein transport protein [Candidatus Magnetomorum sp.]